MINIKYFIIKSIKSEDIILTVQVVFVSEIVRTHLFLFE